MSRIAIFFLCSVNLVLADWAPGLSKNGIVIETRNVVGSPYKEFRATMNAKTTMSKAFAIMQDIPGYTAWMTDCKEAKRIRKISENAGVVYSLQATPWPIAEREAVVEYEFRKTGNPPEISVTLKAVPGILPETPGKVRIAQLKGYWKFTELADGNLRVVYSLHSEPGGNLPSWAIAGMVAHLPYETLVKLREKLER